MNFKNTIILLNRGEEHFTESFYFKKLKSGIDEALYGTDYKLFMSQQDGKLPELLDAKDCERTGFLSLAPHMKDESVALLEKSGIPSVLINCRSEKLSWVDTDNVHAAMAMTEYLIGLGHEKILFVAGFEGSQNSVDRLKGFQQALSIHKIKFNPKLVLNGDFSVVVAYEKMREFLNAKNRQEISAIFAANDMMAVGVVRALIDHGIKVPEDLAVVGFDDFDFSASYYVPLTTYRQPLRNTGFLAAKMLMQQIENNGLRPLQAELIGKLVERESSGAKKPRWGEYIYG